MDQLKTGKFIAELRKEKGLTQMQLAERLGITDKAVSKWERGIAMPDSSIMIELCNILGITVNELLRGEIIPMADYSKEMEQSLVDMARQKEEGDRWLLRLEVCLGVISAIVLLGPALLGAFLPIEEWMRVCVAFSGFIPGIIGFMFAIKIEQIAGYYECKSCGHRYVPSYLSVSLAAHMGRTRSMKCPECGEKTWQKKVVPKESENKND